MNAFANDEDRLRRFEQEARATSALNHPNILTVYDIRAQEGTPYIVAELLEGEDLRTQLDRGAIASRKAIEYAMQITSGLAAAHAKGILGGLACPIVTSPGHADSTTTQDRFKFV